MAETTTAKYAWTKPDPGASANTWGATLNATTDKIDAQVYVNQQAGVPVGAVTMFVGATAPANWLLCQGQSLSTTTYAGLFAVIGYAFGGSGANFNLPNLQQRYPFGASSTTAVGASGGQFTYAIAPGMMPIHSHPIVDVAHSHGVTDPTHTHTYYDPTHTHGASEDAHNHSVTIIGATSTTGVTTGGGPTVGIAGAVAYTTSTAQPAVHINGAYTGINIGNNGTGVTIQNDGTGLSATGNSGGNLPFNVIPPYQAINFIIRYQ